MPSSEIKEYEKKIQLYNILRSWNLRPKSDLIICFWASLVMISFEVLNLIFYTWVFNTAIEIIMKGEKNPI